MPPGNFEVYEDRSGRWRWRLKEREGRVCATGEAYPSKEGAKRSCQAVQRACDGATIEEVT